VSWTRSIAGAYWLYSSFAFGILIPASVFWAHLPKRVLAILIPGYAIPSRSSYVVYKRTGAVKPKL
jgi:hypothetical protein